MATLTEIRQKYPQYDRLSDDQLAGALHQKFYSDMPEAEFRAKIGMTPPPEPAAALHPEPEATIGSTAKAFGAGAVRGLSGVAGLPGDVLGWVDAGVRNAPRLFGAPAATMPERTGIGKVAQALEPPTTPQITSAVEQNVTGPLYQPQNKAEKYAATFGEFLPAAASGPGGIARRVTQQALAPAIASESAGQLAEGTPLEGAARFAGALAPAGMRTLQRRPAMPSVADMETGKQQAYKVVDSLGARYTPGAYGLLTSSIRNKVKKEGISPIRHDKAMSMIDDMEKTYPGMFATPGSPTLSELDQVRQVVRRDLSKLDDANSHFGEMITDRIDAFIDSAGPAHMVAGNAKTAADAISNARKANTQFRKAELLEYELDKARRQAAVTGSGGNVENTVRQAINRILNKPAQLRSFTAQERAIMQKIADPKSTKQDILRLTGKLSPAGNGLMAALSLGATAFDPMMAIPAATGIAAKLASEGMTQGRVNRLEQLVRTGGITPSPRGDAARQAAIMSGLSVPAPPLIELNAEEGRQQAPQNWR